MNRVRSPSLPALFSLLLAACSESHSTSLAPATATVPVPDGEPAVVRVARPREETLTRVLRLPGNAEPLYRVGLGSRVSGAVAEVKVDRGDRVRQGQVLARLLVPDIVSDLARARAAIAVAQAEKGRDEAHAARLKAASRASREAVAPARLEAAEATVLVAKAKLGVAEAELQRLQTLLGDATIRAPFNAVVTERRVDPGAFVQASATARSTGTPLFWLEHHDTIRVIADIPEPDVMGVRVGTAVTLEGRALAGRLVKAQVARVSQSLDPVTRTMRVEIDHPNRARTLLPGMDIVVTIDLGARAGVLTVPAEAIRSDTQGPFLWVVVDGKARRQRVRVGVDTGARSEIREGLRATDKVVLAGHALLDEGRDVRAQEVSP